MTHGFFLADIKSYPFGQTALGTETIEQGFSLENMFGHFDDFTFRNFYNLNRIDKIKVDKKFIMASINMPLSYKIKLSFDTIQKINNDADTFLVMISILEGEMDYAKILKELSKQRINKEKVIIITSCYSHLENQFGLKFVYIDYWESFTRYHQRFLPNATDRRAINLDTEKKFLCLNRNQKAHRIWFYFNLYRLKMHKQSHTSYHLPLLDIEQYNTMARSSFVTKYIPSSLYPEYEQFLNKTYEGIVLDKLSADPINYNSTIYDYYNDSLFSIVTESSFRFTFLTEKTFKAIVHCHPFFIIGNKQHHWLLRENGYHTFEDFFDIEKVENFDEASSLLSKIKYTDIQDYKNKFGKEFIDKLYSNYENFYNRRISWLAIEKKLFLASGSND
jgi:hypothetical protein